jgi:hypothetical protein
VLLINTRTTAETKKKKKKGVKFYFLYFHLLPLRSSFESTGSILEGFTLRIALPVFLEGKTFGIVSAGKKRK